MVITGRLALVGALGVVAVAALGSWWAFWGFNALLACCVGFDVVRAASVGAVQLSRSGDTVARLDTAATVTLAIENTGARDLHGVVRDAWAPSAGVAQSRTAIDVPAGERRFVKTVLRPTRRGPRRSDRVTVRAVGPLGLAARQRSVTVPWTVDVLPAFRSRKYLPSRLARLRDLEGRTAVLVRGQGTEFDSLREYVVGDDVRSIDWRASARSDDVMVRTWRPERDRHVVLVIDAGRTSAGRVGDEPRLDAAMEAALLLSVLASRAGDRVELLVWDRGVRGRVQGESGGALLAAATRMLAPIEASLVETDWRGLVGEVLRRVRQRSLVVLLSPLEPTVIDEGLLPVLRQLTSRHLVVLASVSDPLVTQMAGLRTDADAVYGAASAEQSIADRRRAEASLRRHGAEVVDDSPEQLAPALADLYLGLKAAGRL
ncbi:MAG: DUF58 domain-containing protein [Actinomycetes bacterium]